MKLLQIKVSLKHEILFKWNMNRIRYKFTSNGTLTLLLN